MRPARAVFERMSAGDRLAHRDRRDREHPPPPLLAHRRAPPRCTSRCARGSSARTRRGTASSGVVAKLPGGGPPPLAHEDVDPAERVARRRARTPVAPVVGRHVGDERHRAAADLGRGGVDRAPASRPQIATVHALVGERLAAAPSPSPATPRPPRPARPRSRGPSIASRRVVSGSGPALSRSDGAARPVRERDDLGADRRPRSPPACGRRCRARSAHDPRELVVGRRPPRAAARSACRACVREPIAPRYPTPVASAPTIAGTSNLLSWVSTQTASRGPRSSPTFSR